MMTIQTTIVTHWRQISCLVKRVVSFLLWANSTNVRTRCPGWRAVFFLAAMLASIVFPLAGRAEERHIAVGVDRAKNKLLIRLKYGFVGTAPTAEPGVFIGNIQLLTSGTGTDVVDSISCAHGWNARIVIPKAYEKEHVFNAAGQVVITSVGLVLVPGGWIGWSFDPSNDEGHLEFSGGNQPLKIGSHLRCSFNFHNAGHMTAMFRVIKDTKSLIFGF